MDVAKIMSRIWLTHVDEWPTECWNTLVEMIKKGGLAELRANKFEAIQCLLTLIAWGIGKWREPPVIGAESLQPFALEDLPPAYVAAEHKVATEGVGESVVAMLVARLVGYLVQLIAEEDGAKVGEWVEQALAWLRERL